MRPAVGQSNRPRICFVVASPDTAAAFLNPHIEALSDAYDVDVAANFTVGSSTVTPVAHRLTIPAERALHPLRDLRALWRLLRLLRQGNYSAVHSVTPKAGLLAMTAGRLAGVPNRLHWFTGQVWATRTGVSRRVLKLADRITASLATAVLVDSPSQLDFLMAEGVLSKDSATVLGDGSICGVDTDRFTPDPVARERVRAEMAVEPDGIVVLYVGRVNPDKGVDDLAHALTSIHTGLPLHLIMAGTDETRSIPGIAQLLSESAVRFTFVGQTDSPEELMAAADIFCMPSHREGFGLSVIEASACSLPCVASAIYGLTDAVADGQTGLLFPAGNRGELARRLQCLVDDSELRVRFGQAGRERVIALFSQQRLTSELVSFYRSLVLIARSQPGDGRA